MGKNLIGLDLRKSVESIIRGDVSLEDVGCIYDDRLDFSNDNRYKELLDLGFKDLARNIAVKEAGSDADLFAMQFKINEVLPQVEKEARKIIASLVAGGKVKEFRYIIPKGRPERATFLPEEDTIGVEQNIEDKGVFRVNDKNYVLPFNVNTLYEIASEGKHIWYNNELEVLAELLKRGDRVSDMYYRGQAITASGSMAMVMFPQYEKEIRTIIERKKAIAQEEKCTKSDEPLPGMDYTDLIRQLDELVNGNKAEHTVSEIAEVVQGVRYGEFNQGLNTITQDELSKKQDNVAQI